MAEPTSTRASKPLAKSASAFRTISEVSQALDVPQHVLRFWESKFSQIKPLKRGGGRRYYRPEDVDLLRNIRDLLYTEGYTIRGVQKLLRENGAKSVVNGTATNGGDGHAAAPAPADKTAAPAADASRKELADILAELESIRDSLRDL